MFSFCQCFSIAVSRVATLRDSENTALSNNSGTRTGKKSNSSGPKVDRQNEKKTTNLKRVRKKISCSCFSFSSKFKGLKREQMFR